MTTLTEPTRTDDVTVPSDPSSAAAPAADRSSAGNGGEAGDGEYAVLMAAFEDEAAAGNARERLSYVGAHGAEIKSIATMRADACGVVHVKQITDDSTKTGAKAGLLGGMVAGVLLPPPLVASVVVLGMAGAVMGKLRYEHRKVEAGAALLGTVEPNKAGLLAIVKAADVEKATTALPIGTPVRTSFVDKKTASHLDQASRLIA